MALENIVGVNAGQRWIYAFAFGLIHGFGFSFALREQLQFAGDNLVTSLLGFNVGVEIGQLTVLIVMVSALSLLFKYVVAERMGVIILSALVAYTGWHWMLDHSEQLTKYPVPKIDAAFLIMVMRGMMAALVLAAIVWAFSGLVRRFMQSKDLLSETAVIPATNDRSADIQWTADGLRRSFRPGRPSRPREFHPEPLTGRVEDWRAGLGRSLFYWDRSRARPAVGGGPIVQAKFGEVQ